MTTRRAAARCDANHPTPREELPASLRLAEYRPNPIAMTTCKILKIDETNGIVHIADIDAYNGTPIVDLKAYFQVCDRVKDARIPEWLSDWPEWMPEDGIGP